MWTNITRYAIQTHLCLLCFSILLTHLRRTISRCYLAD